MTDSSAIATALNSLDLAISEMNTHAASASRIPTAFTPLLGPYNPVTNFDLSSWSRATTYANVCVFLSKPWDGQIETFPYFIVYFCVLPNKVKWSDVTPYNIHSIPTRGNTNCNILTKYHSISSVNIVDAFAALTNDRAIQNSKASYTMLSKSVTRNICNTVFEQSQNLPSDKYSVALFKLFTSFTTVVSVSNYRSHNSNKTWSSFRQRTTTSSPKSTPISPICSWSFVCPSASSTT